LPCLTLFPYTTLFRSGYKHGDLVVLNEVSGKMHHTVEVLFALARCESIQLTPCHLGRAVENAILQCRDWLNHFELNIQMPSNLRSEEHTSELQSRENL